MSTNRSQSKGSIAQAFNKILLSGFVIFSFVAYAVHERFSHPDSVPPTEPPSPTDQVTSTNGPAKPAPVFSPAIPTQVVVPTATTEASVSQGHYKDGTYKGPTVNVYYGVVSVQATIQHGSIVNVQFIQYPNDRRTSVRINSIAMPYLQQEAIQAQTANINLISGATLTSEGFVMSLDAALKSAKN